jgi:hypothetical protein
MGNIYRLLCKRSKMIICISPPISRPIKVQRSLIRASIYIKLLKSVHCEKSAFDLHFARELFIYLGLL